MKEVPEKIYMSPAGVLYKGDKQQSNDIEYTRIDVFIEKAWEWVENNILSSDQQDKSLVYYKQFINYMKGEQ